MRHSLGIKNLTIALEALSRVPGSINESFTLRIQALLDGLLTEEEELLAKRKASTPTDDEIPIPF